MTSLGHAYFTEGQKVKCQGRHEFALFAVPGL